MDLPFRENDTAFSQLKNQLGKLRVDSLCRLSSLSIASYASPEGVSIFNQKLSDERAASTADFIRQEVGIEEPQITLNSFGIDWQGLDKLVEESDMPYRAEVLQIIRKTPVWVIRNQKVVDSRKRQLQMVGNGMPWHYMSENFFPDLRRSVVRAVCQIEPLPDQIEVTGEDCTPDEVVIREETDSMIVVQIPEPIPEIAPAPRKPFYMAMKTNMLYDAALVPNIGAEFYVGKGWTVGANWMYAWWWSNKQHNYWRIYGGELDVRKYFGERARQKPLTGHHVGIYGQMLTYDFETGSTGYLSKLSYGAGIEYGYSLPIGRRLNIDFGIGIGYLGGEYKVYDPKDGCYVWRETKQRRWFGPTKAEVSLVWLIGYGNVNQKKGGVR